MTNYLIIAATSGIGKALTHQLKSQGHNLFLTGRNETQIRSLATEHECQYAVLDATDFTETETIFNQAQQALGSLDGVVCLAGVFLLKPAHMTSPDEYQSVIDGSLKTSFSVVRAAGKTMKSGGSVVLISSGAAMHGFTNHEAIAASKAGVIGLARSAAATYGKQNLRFNVIAPGLTETPMTEALTKSEIGRKASEAMHALGRIGTPDKIASGIQYFLDPTNDWVTGQVLAVDGGLSRVAPKVKV